MGFQSSIPILCVFVVVDDSFVVVGDSFVVVGDSFVVGGVAVCPGECFILHWVHQSGDDKVSLVFDLLQNLNCPMVGGIQQTLPVHLERRMEAFPGCKIKRSVLLEIV